MNLQIVVSQPMRHYCSVCGVKIHYQSKSGLCQKHNAQHSAELRLKAKFKKKPETEKYALLHVSSCPHKDCGLPGSMHQKWVLNKAKKKYRYYFVAHYLPPNKVLWHYIPKDTVVEMLIQARSLPNTNGSKQPWEEEVSQP